ncbi:MAG: hypothetical protein JSU63_21285 [Phycisphaerales bacterium]|nr:MAG: hypothetical protein JSU63_21285 [Phycisphaerales bacterium]
MASRLLFSKHMLAGMLVPAFLAIGTFGQDAGHEIRFNPVSASGDVMCLPGEGGCDPTEVVLFSGGVTVTLFLELSGWDRDVDGSPTLGAFEGTVDATTYEGGLAADVAYEGHPGNPGTIAGVDLLPVGYPDNPQEGAFQALKICTSNLADPEANADWLSMCNSSADCPPFPAGCIDRPDYVFDGIDNWPTVVTQTLDYAWRSAAAPQCAVDPDGGVTRFYGGTLLLEVPIDATGTYHVSFRDDPNYTVFNNCESVLLPGLAEIPAQITVLGSRCCSGIGTDDPQCFSGISQAECDSMPAPRTYGTGITCAVPCAECASSEHCGDPTPAQDPAADNLCTDDMCAGGRCLHAFNYDDAIFCCDPDLGPQGGLTLISDGQPCSIDTCDPDTGLVTHEGGDCDNDGACDDTDNCPTVYNLNQLNDDGDAYGDACDGPFDADHDGDVDLGDFASFFNCQGGPLIAASIDCRDVHDFDGDAHVDLRDVLEFEESFTGEISSPCE